jgi:uncharacterized protein YecE (DUF72 family)
MAALRVGTSGWSYPSWRPGFYSADAQPGDFLRLYAERFDTVELNTTGYRLPGEEQFDRWAAQTPPGFRFAVKMPPRGLRELATFEERVRRLGDRLGPIRVVLPSARDEGLLELLLGSIDPALRYAFDFRHDSWGAPGVDARLNAAGAVRVGALAADAPFRYLRLRDPPYEEADLRDWADRIRPLVAAGVETYCYLRHEDAPTAPAYADRLRALLLSSHA